MSRTVFDCEHIEDDKRVAYLLSGLGAKAYAALKNLVAPQAPKECSMDRIKELLVNYFKPRPLVIAKRFVFHKQAQLVGETVSEFVMKLRCLV